MENNINQKGRTVTMIFMIFFQVLGSIGLLLLTILAVMSMGYEDDKYVPNLALIQLLTTTTSWFAWVPFKQGKYLIAIFMAILSFVSFILLVRYWAARDLVYN